jgi:GNAT superfamily N-acetyltransferase
MGSMRRCASGARVRSVVRVRHTDEYPSRVQLRDGAAVILRPVNPSDGPLLAEGFARLSAESRRLRFLGVKKELSAMEVRYFTDVDHFDHEAIGAIGASDGRGVGIARYVRNFADPHRADVAVTVIDEWQRRGLGAALLAALSGCASRRGIRQFSAVVAGDNVAVVRLLRRMDADVELISSEPDRMEYDIFLRTAPSSAGS